MDTTLLVLLLLLGSATATHTPTASLLQLTCEGPDNSGPVVQASQCPVLPCSNSKQSLTLALPVLLTLEDPFSLPLTQDKSLWGMTLHLQDDAKALRVADLSWDEQQGDVALTVWTCDSPAKNEFIPNAGQNQHKLFHLEVAATGKKVNFNYLTGIAKITVMTLPVHAHMPSKVTVVSATGYGYSAPPTIPTITTSTTTTQSFSTPTITEQTTSTSNITNAKQKDVEVVKVAVPMAACTLLLVAGLLLLTKCRLPYSLPTTTIANAHSLPTSHVLPRPGAVEALTRSEDNLSRHDSENSLYRMVPLQMQAPLPAPRFHHPARLSRPDSEDSLYDKLPQLQTSFSAPLPGPLLHCPATLPRPNSENSLYGVVAP